MQVSYKMSKKDLKLLMEKEQQKSNFISLIIASTYYIILNLCLSLLTFKLFYLSYIVFMALVWLLLQVINKYYLKYLMQLNDQTFNYFYGESTITINDNILVQKDSHKETELNLQETKKIVIRPNTIIIIPLLDKQKSLIFYKTFFKDENDFNQIKEHLKTIIEKK